ncbi:hypothetical protein [Actinomadura livida]|uniref:Uncharacterized protein n=1 Tax=Actinomadura livida TaxID=79909 RepID=A0A7W7N0W6_9ACTN|nr:MULTISPECIES: hypothetical protein [Actinomadura]MBB4777322.1 hypothetical protein [Actinomadura catellatispora]GGU20062.1 hypothetical protein GCM10010208_51240 [Actinomadura livida]
MAYRYDIVHRLEPLHTDADLGRELAAPVADPAWFLGRQWQLGEHRGEDAGSPVRVEYRAAQVPIRAVDAAEGTDPRVVPAEAIIEAEPDDFWTTGRRVAFGRAVEQRAADAGRPLPGDDERLRLTGLPVPYDVLNGTGFDGQVLFARRVELDLPEEWFPEPPVRVVRRDQWNSTDLAYDADFRAGATTLTLRRHDGGEVDWWSVDADAPLPEPDRPPRAVPVLASRVQYPGAPSPRWWEIEETRTDIGAYGPDRGHFATLLLVELVSSHSGDWFTFPVASQAGHVLTLHEVTVVDAFGDGWTVEPPDDGWTLFAVTGLDQRSLVLWPTVPAALAGPVLDQVDLGVDEDANLVWAVERRIAGRDLPTPDRPAPAGPPAADGGRPGYAYQAGGEVPPFWHPYVIEESEGRPRRLVQGRLADLSGPTRVLMPPPASGLLRPTPGGEEGIHRIEPAAVPADGLQLERRTMLGRRTDGLPVLWQQRRRVPLAAPPTMRLQHDTFI